MDSAPMRSEWQARKVEDWLLAILRFAITLNDTDLSLVRVLADDMDRLGVVSARTAFGFFERTSIELCRAIAARNDPNSLPVLRRHLARIDDPRLRRAFVAVTEIDQFARITARKLSVGAETTARSGSGHRRQK
ncbi:MAG: hypothetical protein ACXWKA_20120 [Xanthobacteraceae bacterium]